MPQRRTEVVPASIGKRLLARYLDLFVIGPSFLAVFVPWVLLDGSIPVFAHQEWEFTSAIWAGAVAGVVAEFLMLGYKGTTFGKAAVEIALVEFRRPAAGARPGRLVLRFLLVVVECGLVFVFSVTVAGETVPRLDEAQLFIHLVVALAVTWLLSLLSALSNGDRRGWHDLVAGTMLVRAPESPITPGAGGESLKSPEGDVSS